MLEHVILGIRDPAPDVGGKRDLPELLGLIVDIGAKSRTTVRMRIRCTGQVTE